MMKNTETQTTEAEMMAYNCTSFYKNLNVTSDELIAEFERRQIETPASLIDLRENGCRYAHQDFDVMGHAIRLLAGGNDFEHVYVEIFERRHSFSEHDLETCRCTHRRMGHIQGFGACLHFLSGIHPSANCECKRFESARQS